ncbi:MAG TPA: DNA-directed RNA polymerase subunit L [Candidatus Bathyarchaeia archaeon]|nr:DNA-directed RNA polymerase subunit L [Candidatus Bathyarchaeia archaeon]
MNIKIIRATKDEAEIEFLDEGHTFLSVLKYSLLQDPQVEIATYDVKHPMISNPIFHIKTESKDPLKALQDASLRLKDEFESLLGLIRSKSEAIS